MALCDACNRRSACTKRTYSGTYLYAVSHDCVTEQSAASTTFSYLLSYKRTTRQPANNVPKHRDGAGSSVMRQLEVRNRAS